MTTRKRHAQQRESNSSETQRRLKILSEDERMALFDLPCFTPEERTEYFALSQPEQELLRKFRSVKSQLSFVLQLGYFKASRQFFVFDFQQAADDLQHVLKRHFGGKRTEEVSAVDRDTRSRQQSVILSLFGYRHCNAPERKRYEEKARQAAKVCGKPLYIFRELMRLLAEERIVAPGYSSLQDMVSGALTFEQQRLTGILRRHITPADCEALRRLLEDADGLHEITRLKRDPKGFTNSEVKQEVRRGEQIRDLYRLAQRLLPELAISNDSVRYYASLVGYYSAYRLKRFDEWTAYLYLLCFVHHRYQQFHDNLIGSLLYHVRDFADEAKEAAKQQASEQRTEAEQNLQKAGQVLQLFTDDGIADAAPFRAVRQQAFGILEREKLAAVADRIAARSGFDEAACEWEHVDGMSKRFKCHLRPVLQAVDFGAASAKKTLLEAAAFLKEAFRKGNPLSQYPLEAFPAEFIPDNVCRYLYGKDERGRKRLLPDRYEFLVYRQLKQGVEAVDITCRDSVRYRSFDDDLVDAELWRRDKARLLAECGLVFLDVPPREHLASLKELVEDRLTEVNGRILSGANEHFQIKKRGINVSWTLQNLPASESANHPVFDTLQQVDIIDVLRFADRECGFLGAFTHVLGRYAQQEPEPDVLFAALTAWGINMRPRQMGEICDISPQALTAASDDFIRLETLGEGDRLVCNATARLPIFRQYDIGGKLHSSSDGQKFETRIDTVNARHSPKYFGLGKGIVSNNLVINHLSPNAKVISPNDHESRYVYDILANNTTDIRPEVHSTDSHGINAVNFALLHLLTGYEFAPRYSDIREKTGTSLYGFQHPTKYDEQWLLKPIRKLNEELIEEEWDNFLRILVSLALKTTSQSIIVGKLSSHARRSKTKRAIWEYDHIIETLHLLKYIDDPVFRKNIQHALNRGESYHQLRRAVSHANFGKLRFKTEHEQEIWNECARLISNCIIFYNMTLLSRLWEYRVSIGDHEGAAEILKISPVAWHHINFRGRFKFRSDKAPIDIEAIVRELAQIKDFSELHLAA